MRDCGTIKSLYDMANEKGQILLLMTAHVDDVISVCVPDYEHILDKFSQTSMERKQNMAYSDSVDEKIFKIKIFLYMFFGETIPKSFYRLVSPELDDP